jgi:hippurate hydrolase
VPVADSPPPSPVRVAPKSDHDDAVQSWLAEHLGEVVGIYERIHANPELSLQEHQTAALVADALVRAGYAVSTGIGGTGVVGVFDNGPGPAVLLRGDMDALPIVEETGLPYASTVRVELPEGGFVGVMHACGHDVHTASLVGTAMLLAARRREWRGTLIVVAQPAEEIGKGARLMIEDGLFERFPRPETVLALHVAHDLPAGTVGYTTGWAAANVDSIDVVIHGRGGHGARPHETIDPIVTAAHAIVALQTLASRRIAPGEPAVVTVGSIHGGAKHNVIPDAVTLQLTVRSYSDGVRAQLLDGVRQIVTDTCATFQCPASPSITVKDEYTPAAYNDPELTAAAVRVFAPLFGAAQVVARPADMGGEDFGRYARALGVPGLLFRIGTVSDGAIAASAASGGAPLPSLHSSRFAPLAEPTLRTGIRATGNLLLALFAPGAN